jgi:hypothetical protein
MIIHGRRMADTVGVECSSLDIEKFVLHRNTPFFQLFSARLSPCLSPADLEMIIGRAFVVECQRSER